MDVARKLWRLRRLLIGWFTPLLYSPILVFFDSKESQCLYVVLVMVTYWFSEAIPIAVTALLPILLFPLLKIVSSNQIVKPYMNGTIMILLGSLIAATAVEKSNLNERIALKVILLTGISPRRLLVGLMFTTAVLSMLVSNIASVALMIPIVNAALDELTMIDTLSNNLSLDLDQAEKSIHPYRDRSCTFNRHLLRLHTGILLGICYAANIGGTGTLIGSPVNLVLNNYLAEKAISFSDWLFFNLPGVLILLLITWAFLVAVYLRKTNPNIKKNSKKIYKAIEVKYEQLGAMSFSESAVVVLFTFLLLSWFFRSPDFMKGWSSWIVDDPHYIQDSLPTMLVVALFFLIPTDPRQLEHSPMLLDWKSTQQNVSWSVLLLLAGGFAMAKGCEDSGLSRLIGQELMVMESWPHWAIMVAMCLVALVLTELISNTATCSVMLPVINQMAISIGMNPLLVILPVTVCCTFAMMFSFASGPNAIVYEVGVIKSTDMMLAGFVVKIFCVAVLLLMTNTWGEVIFHFSSYLPPQP